MYMYLRRGKYEREETSVFTAWKIKVAKINVSFKVLILTHFKITKFSSSKMKLMGKFTLLGFMLLAASLANLSNSLITLLFCRSQSYFILQNTDPQIHSPNQQVEVNSNHHQFTLGGENPPEMVNGKSNNTTVSTLPESNKKSGKVGAYANKTINNKTITCVEQKQALQTTCKRVNCYWFNLYLENRSEGNGVEIQWESGVELGESSLSPQTL